MSETLSPKKKQILQAALGCFTRHGLSATTISMIREASGASVGSLYHHFGSKEAIAAALYMQGMEDHFQQLRAALEASSSAESGVKAVVRTYCKWISDNPDWARFIFSSRGEALDSDQEQELARRNRVHYEFLRNWFMPYAQSGQLRNYPMSVYHSLLVGPSQDYAKHWLSGRQKRSLDEFTELFCDAAWQVMQPQPTD